MFGPVRVRPDGTHVFAAPIGSGHVPMVALPDLGFFARHIFDHRGATSAQELAIASDWVSWPELVSTFTRVTGRRAEFVPLDADAWCDLAVDADVPLAAEGAAGDTTWRENMRWWWKLYRDDLIQRDFGWLRSVHPGLLTLEKWMRTTGYTGEFKGALTKSREDGARGFSAFVEERVDKL